MTAAFPLMTLDEYLKTSDTTATAELAYGLLRVGESPSERHQSTVMRLRQTLDTHVRARDIGQVRIAPLDVVLDAERALVVRPDLLFVAKGRQDIVRDRIYGAPDLIVEVLSPHPRIGQTEERVRWFAEYGVGECWLVHRDQMSIDVIQFSRRRTASRRHCGRNEPIVSKVLPDFTFSLDSLLHGQA